MSINQKEVNDQQTICRDWTRRYITGDHLEHRSKCVDNHLSTIRSHIQNPLHSPLQSPFQSPFQSPPQSPFQSPYQSPCQSPYQSPLQSPLQSPSQSPLQSPHNTSPEFNSSTCWACREGISNQEAHYGGCGANEFSLL